MRVGAYAAGNRGGRACLAFALLLMAGLGGGCNKPVPPRPLLPSAPLETVARIQWVGIQQLATDTNSASVMEIWNLPESKALEAQTLDRLAVGLLGGSWQTVAANESPASNSQSATSSNPLAAGGSRSSALGNQVSAASNAVTEAGGQASMTNRPSPITNRPPPGTNQHALIANRPSPSANQPSAFTYHPLQLTGAAALLRPLLDDVVREQSFANVRQATNLPGELVFAIQLNEERGRLWHTNLAGLLESLTGSHAAPIPGRTNGWQLQFTSPKSPLPNHSSPVARTFDLARVGGWTVVGLAPGRNGLLDEVLTLVREEAVALAQPSKDFWLFAEVDLRRVASALSLGWDLPVDLPRMSLGVSGEGKAVRTRGRLNFTKPLPIELEPWNIPTNLIHEPLVSFTAMRGIQPWLSSWPLWQGLQLGTPPNQLFLWAQNGPDFLSYLAAPMANASNVVERVTEQLLQKPNAYLATEGLGRFGRAGAGGGVIWSNVPLTAPFLQPVALSGGDFVFGGLVPSPLTNRPPPSGLIRTVLGDTNLVAYDWETTGTRVDQWLHFGQLIRFALHVAQVPPESASFAWLKALEPKLGNCVTAVGRTGPDQLSMIRRSGLGVSADELDWLADWLESPQFPRGLNTFLGEPTPLRRPRLPRPVGGTSTNAVPAVRH